MKACSLELPVTENQNIQIRKTEKGYEIHALKETEITAQLSGRGETDDLLAVKFHVKNQNLQRDMYIRLEGQTNRLSAEKGYEYANKNQDFSYTVTTEKQKDKGVFIFGKGSYITHWRGTGLSGGPGDGEAVPETAGGMLGKKPCQS